MYLPRTWPVGIPLLTDESFSSWFARIAWAHGATPSELYRIALPGGRIGGIDLDRHDGLTIDKFVGLQVFETDRGDGDAPTYTYAASFLPGILRPVADSD